MTGERAMLTLLPARDRRPTAWKNGQGRTTEIAIHPPGAALSAFDWRASMAEVSQSGPFSEFPGVNRWLAVLEGEMALAIADAAPVVLSPRSDPIRFPGDVPVESELRRGPVRDLNIMTFRERVTAEIRRVNLAAGATMRLDAAGEALVICLGGAVRVSAGGRTADLGDLDAARIAGEAELTTGRASDLVIATFAEMGGG